MTNNKILTIIGDWFIVAGTVLLTIVLVGTLILTLVLNLENHSLLVLNHYLTNQNQTILHDIAQTHQDNLATQKQLNELCGSLHLSCPTK